jgi:hypothetical protein
MTSLFPARMTNMSSELADATNRVIVFYATSLASTIGHLYQPPSLAFFARHWFDSSSESFEVVTLLVSDDTWQMSCVKLPVFYSTLKSPTCLMMKPVLWWNDGSTIVRHGDQFWLLSNMISVPCLQPPADRESISAALALFLCGYIAAEKYSLLSARYYALPGERQVILTFFF